MRPMSMGRRLCTSRRRPTAPISRFRSFPAYATLGSLDKAFFRGAVYVREAHMIRTKLAKQASDHLPLVIDFHLSEELLAEARNGNDK